MSLEEIDRQLALDVSEKAAQNLLRIRREGFLKGESGRALSDVGDRISEEIIRSMIESERPDDAILSEEQMTEDQRRFYAERVWIIDPLDGSREFGTEANADWAIHVALWNRSQSDTNGFHEGKIALSVVTIPATGETYTSFWTQKRDYDIETPIRIVVSNTRAPEWLSDLGAYLNVTLLPRGSAGVKAMEVVAGRADAYVHSGGQYEWDSAAPVGVSLAAGLHASRLDGTPLRYNQPDPYLPDLVICKKTLAPLLLEAIWKVNGTNAI